MSLEEYNIARARECIHFTVRDDVHQCLMLATFNNISVISWRSVLLVEETRVPRENHQPATSH